MPALKTTRSAANSRVTLVSEGSAYTTLRRSTRSTTKVEADVKLLGREASDAKLDLSSYAYEIPRESPRKRVKLEPEDELREVEIKDEIKVERKSPKKTLPLAARAKAHAEPARWREQYALIERMRAGLNAPVDTMGCERPQTMQSLDPKTLRFHILISLMLSSQTKDAVTSQAVTNLHLALGGLNAETLAAADPETVSSAINKVGFWRRKTEYIQEAARRLLEKTGDVPKTIEELCELRGVGPKMGFLALQAAWNINAGIGVDVHVHRITNRLKWHKPPTQTPEQTRINLESWLPAELHKPINPLLVGFGQVICLPVGPRCDICLLGQDKLCPSRVAVNAANRKEVLYTFTAGPKVEIGYEGVADGVVKEVVKVDGLDEVEVKVEEQ